MDSRPKSLEEQLADALRENEALHAAIRDCKAALKQAQEDHERSLEGMRIANQDLQHFSYAASHDLKEPLRTISTYTQLLQRQYADDPHAAEFTSFIVEGVNRMNSLIESLLSYTRTAAPTRRTRVPLSSVVNWALLNLEPYVRESAAQVTCGELPVVVVDESQLVQVFQNLLSTQQVLEHLD